ncbi:MAG: mycofactocin oligosaccharide methyltransferase MftM [Actinomycetota bacterium]|nr:mycofactocin oligosaccharide methyltransferase MftM [Actinomycetota bacterium]
MTLLDCVDPPRSRVAVRRVSCVPAGFIACGRFAWRPCVDGVEIIHRLDTSSISDAAMLDGLQCLVDRGVLAGQHDFEEAALGVIRTSAPDEDRAWAAFYDNSLAELAGGRSPFAPIHRRARSLVVGASVLEVGSCFGFFALQCAGDGHRVHACDISSGAISLLRSAARRRGDAVTAVVGDATALPFDTGSVDTVTLIHLLEHLEDDSVRDALAEALRVARRRHVVAVPYEERPSEHFGHRQQLTAHHLRQWSSHVNHSGAEFFDDHGGWMVLTPGRAAE